MWYRPGLPSQIARRVAGGVAALALASVGLGALQTSVASAAPTPLIGTFTITAGSCSGGVASGTYLRMVLPSGNNAAGPYFSNSDSTCADNSYTPLAAGSGGGLVTGVYQSQPSPAFDSAGNALAGKITAPVPFEGVKFATSTNATDPQTGLQVPVPSITANGTALSGNLEAFGVTWNKQVFNQGSPKPGGSTPGNTTPVTGTYNEATGAYTLQWSSQVVGGPFNNFSAFWNLTGRFIPSSGAPAASAPSTGSATASPTPSGSAPTASSGTAPTASGSSTTSTTTAPAAAAGQSTPKATSHLQLSSQTTTSRSGGWTSPHWLVILVIVLGLLGLVGVLWSEQAIRRQRLGVVPVQGEQR